MLPCGGCILLTGFVHSRATTAAQNSIKAGDEFWDSGEQQKAVAKYQEALAYHGFLSDPVLVKLLDRVITFELDSKNFSSAKNHMMIAVEEDISLALQSDEARQLYSDARTEYEAQREAKRKQLESRSKSTASSRSGAKPGTALTGDALEDMGYDEILSQLGPPTERHRSRKSPNLETLVWATGDNEYTVVTFLHGINGSEVSVTMSAFDHRTRYRTDKIIEAMRQQ